MTKTYTFSMIKPDAVESGYIGLILDKITSSGFKIIAMKFTQLSSREAEKFYDIHKTKPFFGELIKFMTRGPIVAMVLEKDNAVDNFRTLIGSTNPEQAEEGTIRKLYANSVGENAIHGSDSDENAKIESVFHFSGREIFK
ncbi:MAG: nucleoside-diphosphate kinase [Flavobacteriaceae bacterium]|nr:nucleoside-diphosphate kinase [Flavobacteriaceae bacterium]